MAPDSFEVRLEVGRPAEPAGQFIVMVSLRRGERTVLVDSLNSACLDTAEGPPPVRDTAALREQLPELARWHRVRALPEPLGSAKFLGIGLQMQGGTGAMVDRAEAESLEASLREQDPPVLVVSCGPLRHLYVWLRGQALPFAWIAMTVPG